MIMAKRFLAFIHYSLSESILISEARVGRDTIRWEGVCHDSEDFGSNDDLRELLTGACASQVVQI